MKNLFIHLRLHSNFSLAEGMLSFEDLSKFCVENNLPAIAITDTNNLFGALEFSLKMTSYGIQPIIGIQVNICHNDYDEKNIGTRLLFGGNVILQPAYESIELGNSEDFPVANEIANNSFWLGVYPGLNNEMLDFVVDQTIDFLEKK